MVRVSVVSNQQFDAGACRAAERERQYADIAFVKPRPRPLPSFATGAAFYMVTTASADPHNIRKVSPGVAATRFVEFTVVVVVQSVIWCVCRPPCQAFSKHQSADKISRRYSSCPPKRPIQKETADNTSERGK